MKALFCVLTLAFVSTPAFAGKTVSYKNDALDFTFTASAMDDEIEFCDAKDSCLTFEPREFDGKRDSYELCDAVNHCTKYVEAAGDAKNVSRYREKTGKCELEIQTEQLSYGGFMFQMSLQIVKVTKGTKNCQLDGTFSKRELWGIYQ